ncbi:MAG: OmpH family outer membrane protein [Candidatus Cloacimonetes bacterium]|nr:OmpH family outer membrane protein [Candidatus Cloacimonadota bacterium]
MRKYLSALIALSAFALFAESEQIVYYDSDRVLDQNKDIQEAQTTLDGEISAWEAEIEEIDRDIQLLSSEYEEKKLILLPSGQQALEQQLEELKSLKKVKIKEIYGENGRISQRNKELIEPIMNKLQTVIEKLAIEQNYSLVLDAATGVIGYAKPKLDITDEIIEEMGKTFGTVEDDNNIRGK